MNGLLSKAPMGPPMQQEMGPQQMQPQQGPQKPSQMLPDTQETYDLVTGMLKKIFFGKMAPRLKQKFQQNPNSIPATVKTVVATMLTKLQDMMAQKGKRIPPKVIIQSAMKLGRHIAEVALSVKALPPEQEKQVIENAVFAGIAEYGQQAQISPEEAKQYAAVLQEVKQKMGQPQKAQEEVEEVVNEPVS